MNAVRPSLVPPTDLEAILERTSALWRELDGERLFVTGGTGFMGAWLLESLVHARARLGIDLRAVVLSRSPERFRARAPAIAGHAAIQLVAGDVRSFEPPPGPFAAVVHAAADTDAAAERDDPAGLEESIVAGTRRVLECSDRWSTVRSLYVSSGAVYGPQPRDLATLAEDHTPEPAETETAYARAKRRAEALCGAMTDARRPVIARCFAFVGAQLPLDAHFAVGNFLRDAAAGRPIEVRSDGRAVRSYLHGIDLTVWLLTLLVRGRPGRAYNVGSDHAISIGDLAQAVASLVSPPLPVHLRDAPGAGLPPRYVPSIERARRELGLTISVPLPDALGRTLDWARELRRPPNLH